MAIDLKAKKVPGSWLCPTGYGYRETANAEQRANGTGLRNGIAPSQREHEAWDRFNDHIERCPICQA